MMWCIMPCATGEIVGERLALDKRGRRHPESYILSRGENGTGGSISSNGGGQRDRRFHILQWRRQEEPPEERSTRRARGPPGAPGGSICQTFSPIFHI